MEKRTVRAVVDRALGSLRAENEMSGGIQWRSV